MRDPFPPIPALSRLVQPFADKYDLPVLPLHIHEVLFAVGFYTFIHLVVSPWLSMKWFPSYYPINTRGKRVNWDSHVVSLVQSTIINLLALYVIFFDEERKQMDWEQRIYGYTGMSALVQAMAVGYFVWDLITTLLYVDVFGLGLLAHASSALLVYSFGFRPFLNFYASTFILYELSTPFLNVHWFFDKLNMTGSKAQLYNGIVLLFTFFSCRLVWGTFQSGRVYADMWRAVHTGPTMPFSAETPRNASIAYGNDDIMVFAKDATPIPAWLAVLYVGSNIVLNSLNWHWFFKMIKAVRKRFEPAKDAAAPKFGADGSASSSSSSATAGAKIGLDRLDELRRRAIPDIVPTIEDDFSEMQ